jgi:hypothetical protein
MALLDFCSEFRKIAREPPVIRASGARCDITRLEPPDGVGACLSMQGGQVQKTAVLEKPPSGAEGAGRVRHLVLVRIACALRGAAKSEIATDLAPIAAGLPPAKWRAEVDRQIEALEAQGLVTAKSARLEATEAGKAQAARMLGTKGDFPRVWSELRDVRLIAVALGMQREPPRRLKALATLDGLRGAIVESAYKLKIKGAATPARLREGLAAIALKRAFGDKGTAGLAGKLGLSARAGRLLAAQLSGEPRDFGTDTRLIAALAAEHIGSAATDIGALRVAVLRKFFGAASPKAASARRKPAKRALGKGVPFRIEPAPPSAVATFKPAPIAPVPVLAPAPVPPTLGRPDLPGFASEVRRHAASHARGWSGDRKAYISHVWRNIREKRPDWGLSEIEFKCMLAEAHRAGQIALANADLKDKDNIKDVQDSAVSYRNAVFHFIRVDA